MASGGQRKGAGRPPGALTVRTRKVAEQAALEGRTPLEVMLENMRKFQEIADASDAAMAAMSPADIKDMSPEDALKFLLAKAKQAAGFRQLASEIANDAAPYIHPKLSSVAHTGPDGEALQVMFQTVYEKK